MKVIIAGGRDFDDCTFLNEEMHTLYWSGEPGLDGWEWDLEIVSGMARGADTLGAEWASKNNIPLKEFPADWDKHGKAAGHMRNAEMAEYGDVLIAFWNGMSKGTMSMIKHALDYGLEVHVYMY